MLDSLLIGLVRCESRKSKKIVCLEGKCHTTNIQYIYKS
uniref:Uncharacterized protein n=1 Tax=Anguilla anguilla TaxID=7936 RepID=A0A0E9TVV0_ANGAN